MQLIKCDIMQPIQSLLKSVDPDELISVLKVVVNLAFASDIVAQKILTRDVLKSLKTLCAHTSVQVALLYCFISFFQVSIIVLMAFMGFRCKN